MNPVHTFAQYFPQIHFNIILPSVSSEKQLVVLLKIKGTEKYI